MKRIWSLLPVVLFVVLTGCNTQSDLATDKPEDELHSLISEVDLSGELLITSSQKEIVTEFEPGISGTLLSGVHWGILSPEETHTLYLGMSFGYVSDVLGGHRDPAPVEEEVFADCSLATQSPEARARFARCVTSLHDHYDVVWTWPEDDGHLYASGHHVVYNEDGQMDLVEGILPEEG